MVKKVVENYELEQPRFKNYGEQVTLPGIIRSFRNAFHGFQVLLDREYNLYFDVAAGIIVTFIGFFANLSAYEWIAQTIVIGLVIFAELTNTAIEKTMDLVHPEFSLKVKDIKDMAAGSVLFAVLIAIVVGSIIYFPRFASFLYQVIDLFEKI
jgi:diacylglycerol kinase